MSKIRVAINGFGRIGRMVLKAGFVAGDVLFGHGAAGLLQ